MLGMNDIGAAQPLMLACFCKKWLQIVFENITSTLLAAQSFLDMLH